MAHPLAAERRSAPRVKQTFDGTCAGFRSVRICDPSVTGCFVESLEAAAPGERIALQILPVDRPPVDVVGEVVYVHARIGFGVRFVDVNPATRAALDAIVGRPLDPDPA
jgi:hypothetical protein